MFDELFPAEREASLSLSLQRPSPAPSVGAWQGFGSALADALPHAATTAASAWSEVLDSFGKASAYANAPMDAVMLGQPSPDMAQLKTETIDQMGNSQAAREFRIRAKDFTPKPEEVGMAGQIVHGVSSSLAKAGAYALATGPAAPVLFGADMGINRAQELSDQGVDAGTAVAAGLTTGVASAVGLRLPAAMGATRLQSAALGAAVNPALNVAEVGSIRLMLEHADYDKIANQYDPLDPVSLSVAAITGGAFGAVFHGGKAHSPRGEPPAEGPKLSADEHAAALTMHEVYVVGDSALTAPGDVSAANVARDLQAAARDQLDAGEAVSVAQRLEPDPERLGQAYQRVVDGAGEVLDPLMHLRSESIGQALENRSATGAEVSSGLGSIRFLWDDADLLPPGRRLGDNDLLDFPQIVREYRPSTYADDLGMGYREWRVTRQGPDGLSRQVVYVASRGEDGQSVYAYVPEADPSGIVIPDSPSLAEASPMALDAAPASQAMEQGGFLQRAMETVDRLFGREAEPAPSFRPETPEQVRALEIATRDPEAMVWMGKTDEAGNPVQERVADVLNNAREIEEQAKIDTEAFMAAVDCAVRFPT